MNASSSTPGTLAYTPAAGTLLNAGANQALGVSFTPTDANNFTTANASTTITVSRATPMLIWPAPAAISYGTPLGPTQLNATANTAGTFVYVPGAGTVLSAGPSQALAVAFTPGNAANFTSATASTTITVNAAAATIALGGLRQTYDGQPKPVTAVTSPADLSVTITYDGNATAPTAPGSYAVVATITDPNYAGSATGTLVISTAVLVRHAPSLNGGLDGSLQVLLPETTTLNGNAWVSGDLLVPGTPSVQLNGHPTYAGTRDGAGAALPSNYTITLNGNAVLRHVVRRTDAATMPSVGAPPSPTGTRNVSLNSAGDSAGDFTTIRNLTLNGNAGTRTVPAGTYGTLTVNGNSGLILGVAGATTPAIYNLQGLTLNGNGTLQIAGPVVINLASGASVNSSLGDSGHPGWLAINIASGGLTLNGNVTVTGSVTAPNGTVTINGNSTLKGGVIADRLTINGNGLLDTIP